MELKSATAKKCCCNCGHDIRVKDERGMVQKNVCEIDGHCGHQGRSGRTA